MKNDNDIRTSSKYTVYTLDIWGNETDGYDVNNQFNQGSIELNSDFTKGELLDALDSLVGIDKPELAEIDDQGEFIEIRDKTNGIPVFHLYKETI